MHVRASVYIIAGPNFATMNMHLVTHVGETVRSWGPLWCYSCFGFESMNGYIKTFFHGTRQMSAQVGTTFTHVLYSTMLESNSTSIVLCIFVICLYVYYMYMYVWLLLGLFYFLLPVGVLLYYDGSHSWSPC